MEAPDRHIATATIEGTQHWRWSGVREKKKRRRRKKERKKEGEEEDGWLASSRPVKGIGDFSLLGFFLFLIRAMRVRPLVVVVANARRPPSAGRRRPSCLSLVATWWEKRRRRKVTSHAVKLNVMGPCHIFSFFFSFSPPFVVGSSLITLARAPVPIRDERRR